MDEELGSWRVVQDTDITEMWQVAKVLEENITELFHRSDYPLLSFSSITIFRNILIVSNIT